MAAKIERELRRLVGDSSDSVANLLYRLYTATTLKREQNAAERLYEQDRDRPLDICRGVIDLPVGAAALATQAGLVKAHLQAVELTPKGVEIAKAKSQVISVEERKQFEQELKDKLKRVMTEEATRELQIIEDRETIEALKVAAFLLLRSDDTSLSHEVFENTVMVSKFWILLSPRHTVSWCKFAQHGMLVPEDQVEVNAAANLQWALSTKTFQPCLQSVCQPPVLAALPRWLSNLKRVLTEMYEAGYGGDGTVDDPWKIVLILSGIDLQVDQILSAAKKAMLQANKTPPRAALASMTPHESRELRIMVNFALQSKNRGALAKALQRGGDAITLGECLFDAIARDDEASCVTLIGSGASMTLRNPNGHIALMEAAYRGLTAVVQACLDAGADVNTLPPGRGREDALCLAAIQGHTETVKLLIEAGGDVSLISESMATSAIVHCMPELREVRAVLKAAGLDESDALKNASFMLHVACMNGNFEMASLYLEAGVDVNCLGPDKVTALNMVVGAGNEEMALFLLDHGADPNAGVRPDEDPILTVAIKQGQTEVVKALVRAGAHLTAPPITTNILEAVSNRSPLSKACQQGNLEMVQVILEHGAKVMEGNVMGPLDEACLDSRNDVVDMLLDYGVRRGEELKLCKLAVMTLVKEAKTDPKRAKMLAAMHAAGVTWEKEWETAKPTDDPMYKQLLDGLGGDEEKVKALMEIVMTEALAQGMFGGKKGSKKRSRT